jgi:hypothetical protein
MAGLFRRLALVAKNLRAQKSPAEAGLRYSYSIKQSECAIDLSSQFASLKHRLPDESRDPEASTKQRVQMTPY